MTTKIMTDELASRRAFLGGAAALAGCALVPRRVLGGEALHVATTAAGKPSSVFNGVRIGVITYSYHGVSNSAEAILKAVLQNGLSEVELMGGPIQAYAGLGGGAARSRKDGPAEPPAKPTDALRQAQLAKCRELRKMYNDAGVNIHLHKLGFGPSDEEIDFNFQVAKALGCVGITTERSETLAKKLAPFADKHKIWVAFHSHGDGVVMDRPDPILSYGQYIGFNFDVGHYVAGTKGRSPIPAIEKYHDRMVSLHLKDRTADGRNLPWGQGQTPIKEILKLMRKERWTFPADIELEYRVPQGSTSVAEVTKCVQYCREALA